MLSDDAIKSQIHRGVLILGDMNPSIEKIAHRAVHERDEAWAELLRAREALRRVTIYEAGGKYCVHCGEKSGWAEVRSEDMDLTYHPASCVSHAIRAVLPEFQEAADAEVE